MAQDALVARHLSKSFAGLNALQDVSLSLGAGEIRAICGENGAGKSTLVKLLMGVFAPDGGTITIEGEERIVRGPQHAQSLGLGLVAQELSLAPRLSILDNIWLGSPGVPVLHRRAALRARAQAALATLGIGTWDLDTPVSALSIGQQQMVEIARLLARNARILILDEPTATLTDHEIERILAVLKTLKASGRSVIYITHRLGEVFELCDTVTVLRNGEHVATEPVGEMTHERLVELMLGRPFGDMYPSSPSAHAHDKAVVVDRLNVPGAVDAFSLIAPRGNIVCIAGQIGSGANVVTRALAGLVPDAGGRVSLDGKSLRLGSVPHCVERNVLFLSEDRAAEGLFDRRTVLENLLAAHFGARRGGWILNWPSLRRLAERLCERVGVDTRRLFARAGKLSGGNQQKLLFARALERAEPGVLLMNEPTRGIDIGARAEIYRILHELCDLGYCLIMTSSDLEEVVGMADIVVTMYRGRTVARYERGAISMTAILADITHPTLAAQAAA